MAGILANSASKTMTSGDTTIDNNESGYVSGEMITLSVVLPAPEAVTGLTLEWGLSIPDSARPDRTRLITAGENSMRFTPESGVSGYYVVTVVINQSTSYVIRLGVSEVSQVTVLGALNLMPVLEASVLPPNSGLTLFVDVADNLLKSKDSDGNITIYEEV